MATSDLVFIPSPGAGHLPPTVELAKLLLHRDQRLSVTIIIMNLPLGPKPITQLTPSSDPRMRYVEIPCDDSVTALISPKTFMSAFVEHNKPRVRDIARAVITDSRRLVGFVVDMFCVGMMDVADELGAPTYTYFTSGASTLGLMFHVQAKRDHEGYDVTQLIKHSDTELPVPSFVEPVPVKVLPQAVLDKERGSNMFLDLAKKFREAKGIIVNTFEGLEGHALDYFLTNYPHIPPVFAVGPILNNKVVDESKSKSKTDVEIMAWLDEQPKGSVVFLCFGSMGSFNEKQVKEIAVALERGGHRFLWSLRRRPPPPPKDKMQEYPKEYENLEEVLPQGFLERTCGVGKVIGWAPQMAVLSHPSVGGFVSHCGWNSTLESIWCGVPIAAWPLYAEQQLNAFKLVVELGIAAEIRMDYCTNMQSGAGHEIMVTADEIQDGISKMMTDAHIRNKVEEIKDKSRSAVVDAGGSSHASIGNFINQLTL